MQACLLGLVHWTRTTPLNRSRPCTSHLLMWQCWVSNVDIGIFPFLLYISENQPQETLGWKICLSLFCYFAFIQFVVLVFLCHLSARWWGENTSLMPRQWLWTIIATRNLVLGWFLAHKRRNMSLHFDLCLVTSHHYDQVDQFCKKVWNWYLPGASRTQLSSS